MRELNRKWMRWGLVLLVMALLATTPVAGAPTASADAPPKIGIVCTTGPTFTLSTNTGYILLPDGNTMFMWGYSVGGGAFQHPGPVLCVNQGDTVTVILQNNTPKINEPVSIIFPGQENVLANGSPAQPQFDGGGALTSLTNTAAPGGGSVTYSFVATNPGTYIYESGTDSEKQVRMGLFGALIVRPSAGADHLYNQTGAQVDSQFTPSEEFMVLLSEIDPYLNQAVEANKNFNMNNYHPRYWLINGRGFPDSIADNFAAWLPNQPYGALARIHEFNDALPPGDPNYHPYPAAARYLNVGTENYPFHPHGNNGLVIGRDGQPLVSTDGKDLSFEKFAINIGPGQTWDVIFKWYDAEHYDETLNPVYADIPVDVPAVANQTMGQFYSASPYLGQIGALPPGASTLNQCGEYYIISHNHALYQITSWGVVMTGPITYMRIDPPYGSPLANQCSQ